MFVWYASSSNVYWYPKYLYGFAQNIKALGLVVSDKRDLKKNIYIHDASHDISQYETCDPGTLHFWIKGHTEQTSYMSTR